MRAARFAKVTDQVALTSIDMKCRAFIAQPMTVCRLGMKLPEGRLYRGRLVMPRIERARYNKILEEVRITAQQATSERKQWL
jgi:hypothetical protein